LYDAAPWAANGFLDRSEQQIARARALWPEGVVDPWEEIVEAQRARLLVLHGHPEGALAVARDLRRRPRQLIGDLYARSILAAVSFAAGEPDAKELIGDVIAEWRSVGEPDIFGMADTLCVGSELAISAGDLDEAENLAAVAVAILALSTGRLLKTRAEIALANVELAAGRPSDARRRLANLQREGGGEFGVDPAVIALVDAAISRDGVDERQPTARSPIAELRHRASPALVEPLTRQEQAILDQLASHRTYPEIARELFISRHTVKTHVSRIYRKLGVTGRSAAIEAAIANGFFAA
jgi:DNA-binding CsgD family transcriptional regulator